MAENETEKQQQKYKRPETKEEIEAMLRKFLSSGGFAKYQLGSWESRKAGDLFKQAGSAACKYSRLEVDNTRTLPKRLFELGVDAVAYEVWFLFVCQWLIVD